MKVLVDTCIWSLILRRDNLNGDIAYSVNQELTKLITDSRVQMIGPIRQELLSGISSSAQFNKLRTYLAAFPDLIIDMETYEQAATCFNICRKHGIQGSHIDFLICATALHHQLTIFTIDKDFEFFAKVLALKLY